MQDKTRGFGILLAVNFVGLLLADALLDGVYMRGFVWALLAAAILTVLQMVLKPLLLLLTLPFTIMTFGLFLLIINGLIFWLAGSLLDGYRVVGFASALGGAIIVSIVSLLANIFIMNRTSRPSMRLYTFSNRPYGRPTGNFSSRPENLGPRPAQRPAENRSDSGKVIDLESDENGQWKVKD